MRNPASPLGENDFFGNQTRGVKFFRAGVCTRARVREKPAPSPSINHLVVARENS